MSKHSQRNRKRRMIRATASDKPILCDAAALEWIQASEGEAPSPDAPKRFRMRAYTGGPMVVGYYGSPVVIDLSGLRAEAPLPILMNHDPEQIVGHADEVTLGDTTLDLAGVVSGASQEANQVTASAKLGFPWKASVGASPDKMEFVGEGITTKVNGKTLTGPLYVARKSTLGEVSFVAMAADRKTSAKVAAIAASSHERKTTMEFDAWLKAKGIDAEALGETATPYLRELYEKDVKAKAATPPVQKAEPVQGYDLSATVLAYEKQVATIQAKAAEFIGKVDSAKLAEIQAGLSQKALALKSQALNEEWPASRLEMELVKAGASTECELIRAERPKAPAIHGSTKDTSNEVIEAAFCGVAGLRNMEKTFKPEVLAAADAYRRHEGVSLQGMILAAAESAGYAGGARRIHRGNYDEVMKHVLGSMIQASAPSTHTLTTMLSTVGNKFLLEGFFNVESVWREISAVRPVGDFKQITSYRMLDDMVFEELAPSGEIKHGTVSQESYTNQAKTYAKMFAITRTDIINDDLGAFDSIRERIGVGCGKKLNSVFWTSFLDDAVLFNSTATTTAGGHANLLTAVLGETGMSAANVLLKAQKDANGHPLGLGLRHLLLTGATLSPTAKKWYVSQELRDTTASTKTPNANIYYNQFLPVESAYITSTTSWYLLPVGGGSMAPMEVCFLDGVQSPTIESADADFNTLGIQFRGYFDFGVAQKEWRASVKSTGAG